MKKRILVIKVMLPVLLLLSGFGYAGYIYYGYAKGQNEYKILQEEYTWPAGEAKDFADKSAPTPEEKNKKENDMPEKTVWKPLTVPLPEDAPERIQVDWASLKEKNDDLVAWILIPALSISYPVLQGEDNDYYLHRDLNRDYLFAGSIFMDEYNTPSLYNYNTIIYGHNMRDGSMFAALKEFTNKETYEKCRYFWLLTPDGDYLYEICSVHQAASGSETFTVRFENYEHYRKWQEKMLSISDITTGAALEYQDRIVTLSTCTENSSIRMTVQGKLVWKTS